VKPPRVTSSRVVYENKWITLREDTLERADGSPGLYSVVEKGPSAVILPLDGDEVVLIEQWRHPVGARYWELPQGGWEGHEVPDPEELARGELMEETGLRAGSLEKLGRLYYAYGISNQPFDAWLATDLSQGEQALEPEEEGLRVQRFGLAEVDRMLRENVIVDAATVATFGLVRMHRPELLP
jgi:ADP-ribose pyrophosphatase